MANQNTSTNLKLQEQSVRTAVQSQLARIKKEEEEELWISGEELYTEGSSDEEDYKAQTRSRRKVNSNQSPSASPANPGVERRGHSPAEAKAKSDHSTDIAKDTIIQSQTASKNVSGKISLWFEKSFENSLSIDSQRTLDVAASSVTRDLNSSDFSVEEDQVENSEISWKANRGSFVLPNSSNSAKREADKC
ncbi:uncharacterized protein LOC143367862 isoform X2 [Andrena cerasifolii]